MRSSYLTRTFNLIAITDLDKEGHKSVTNDIEAVLADLAEAGQLVPDHSYQRVIYRDSKGRWDQVVIDEACQFVRFAPVLDGGIIESSAEQDLRLALSRMLLGEFGDEALK
ncbi:MULTISPECIES: hypothetical protein [unclassified Paraburkholderia]|uniref:hypothetical protein n=1 Tax=unclassified Paraburkholderia TaxID=2615204 RepID=UPI001616D748|nr:MULTISPECIES: hypothetical protein [unclassified Paraburkholderia]MBB5442957.1 hypothetical protein [Paraburkholderia sp. WSM4177]MBB5483438.1 hypothetical protein [Paraburkholderia sp. WSM4180]